MTISQTNSQRLPEAATGAASKTGLILHIHEQRRLEAVMRLLGVDPVRAERFITFSRNNSVPLDGMWSRIDESGRITHTVLAVPSPGKTAMIFASKPRLTREVPIVAGLIDHAAIEIAAHGVDLAQALLDPSDMIERDAFVQGGFKELARLSYLERPLGNAPRRNAGLECPSDVCLEPYGEDRDDELIAILEASYEDTLDCPGLRGLRQTRDILAGHKGTGSFEPSLWTLMRVKGRPAGALLLNPSPQQKSIELVYLGLAPFARGRGLGALLLRHGFEMLGGRSERTMTLAVDERNAPALALYKRAGFRKVLRRIALIRKTSVTSASAAARS